MSSIPPVVDDKETLLRTLYHPFGYDIKRQRVLPNALKPPFKNLMIWILHVLIINCQQQD